MRPTGLELEAHKRRPMARSIVLAGPPALVGIALDQGAGRNALPCVRDGETVRIGTMIASADGAGTADLHSPIAGRVRGIVDGPTASGSGTGPCIVIENDGSEERAPGLEPMADVLSVPPPALIRRLARSGIVGLGGAAFPAATKLAEAAARSASHLVLNGAECEPWICCDDALMRERAIDVVQGARVLAHAISATSITVAIEDDKPEAIAAMRRAAASDGPTVDVLALDSRYPAGAERTLATAVTRREVPSGGLPTEIGVLCQNVGTAAAVARFVATGEPLLRRIVTVTGSGIANPANVDASIGTPIAALVAACDGYAQAPVRLIAGGAMTGRALPTDAVPLVKGLNCVIAASASDLAAPASERPCIRCGECAVVCPAILLPQQIHRAVLLGDLGTAAMFGLEDCIECGACDYVCPSRIPLTDRFRAGRVRMHEHAASNARELELSQARAGERRT
jgi:electron transport complex protein RnfC